MSQSIFHVRPLDSGKGWAIDEYDGRGAWQHSVLKTPEGAPMDKQQAQRAVFQLRRKAVNSALKAEPVNMEDTDEKIARLAYRLGRQDQQRFAEASLRKWAAASDENDDLALWLRGEMTETPSEPVHFPSIVLAAHAPPVEAQEEREPLTDITGCDV